MEKSPPKDTHARTYTHTFIHKRYIHWARVFTPLHRRANGHAIGRMAYTHAFLCPYPRLCVSVCACVRSYCINLIVWARIRFSPFCLFRSTPPARSTTTFTYIFGLCVTHNIFALYTSVDDGNNNISSSSDNNLSDGDEKKVHGFAFVLSEAVSMLPPKAKWNGMAWNETAEARREGKETSLSIDGKEKKKGIFRALRKKPESRYVYV